MKVISQQLGFVSNIRKP